MESAALQVSANDSQTKVSRSARGEKVLSSERAEARDHTGAGEPWECQAVLSREFRSPIDVDVVSRIRRLDSLRCRDHHELLLDQELDPQPRPLLWRVHHSDVHDAFRHSSEQIGRSTHLGAKREMRSRATHPEQPVEQQRVPKRDLAADGKHCATAWWNRNLVPRTFPDLHQGRCVAYELLACRSERRAGLVTHKELPSQELFQRPHPGADSGLCHMQALGCPKETACGDYL